MLDALGDLLHFRDQRVGVLPFLFQASDFFAGLVALGLELLGRGDHLAALPVERAERLQIEFRATIG